MNATDQRSHSDAPSIEYGDASSTSATSDELEVLVADAREAGDHASAAAYGEQLAASLTEHAARRAAFEGVASDALSAARLALESALSEGPETEELLQRLQRVCEAAGRYAQAVTAATRLAERATSPDTRARRLVDAAALSVERERNAARAIALYELAMDEDPEVEGAFAAIERVLVAEGDAQGLARAFERQLGRLEKRDTDPGPRARLLERLAELQIDRLGDLRGALATVDALCRLEPNNHAAFVRKADLELKLGDPARAIRATEQAVAQTPFDARLYRRLVELHRSRGSTERASAASAVLVALGEAEPTELDLHARHAPHAPLSFERAFDADAWKAMEPEGYPTLLGQLFETLDEAAIGAWADAARAEGIPVSAPEQNRVDPKTSTIAAVRSFEWASKVLGVTPPVLYARPDVTQVAMATVRAERPAVVLGRPVLAGRSVIELAFLAARHATYLRPGFRLLSFYPNQELEALLRAAVAIARVDGAPPSSKPAAVQLENRLRRNLGESGLSRLRSILAQINDAGSVKLADWIVGVEIMACRAATLASGDVTVATPLLGLAGSSSAGLSARARMGDLFPFVVSDRAAELKQRLGIRVSS